ncbi:MAG: single-stranded-DNA-specific exonuclease RecJ [Bacteroidales bacterium]|nr:single-stranded-DNA-specific exonuclease RecJ [Bacteroidales bacterium]
MQYQWFYKYPGKDEKVEALAKSLKIGIPNARLLMQRGIETFDQARDFFRPKLELLHDPYLMKDMDKAVDRLTRALSRNEKVLVYGDYDVDGTTSVALVYSFLKQFTQNIDYYLPDRYTEGYGVSFKGIDYAKENNCKLIITLDCGIKANTKIDYANELGIDTIICDHHLPGEHLPKAIAILDSKQSECSYPDKDLSGCGVGFKFMQAFAIKNDIPIEETYPLLDLVAVSIASDIVPIVGENRIMAYHGLKILNSNPRIGLQSLIQVSDIQDHIIEISDIVFKIGPRINAAGRLESARKSVELLLEQDYAKAMQYAKSINLVNTERKNLDHQITEEAIQMLSSSEELKQRKTTVICNEEWHKGVLGIVASRLLEHYYRPTIVLTETNGILTGSARSVNGFNIYEAIDACSDLLEGYGGHMYAAGLNLKKENFTAFKDRFEDIVNSNITNDLLIPKIEVDLKIEIDDIDRKFFSVISQMAPFGPGNLKPVFVVQHVHDAGNSKIVGKDQSHLKVSVTKANTTQKLDGIAFGQSQHFDTIKNGAFSVVGSLYQNDFRGQTNIELEIKDIQACD